MRTLFLMMLCSALLTPVSAKSLEVSPTGEISTIKAALSRAQAGDTVIVGPGVYSEYNLKIDTPITLRGVGGPVIDGQLQGTILAISADAS